MVANAKESDLNRGGVLKFLPRWDVYAGEIVEKHL
jgi:hypothetical protein